MSAFEVKVTPTRRRAKKLNQSQEPTDVIMAPFTGKAVVLFEDVPVTKTAKRFIRIINPSEESIKIKVIKSISPEHNFTLDWAENSVPAKGKISMEMIWSPQITVACNETVQLADNRNFRKDIMVILKSKPAGQIKNVRKFPNISLGNNTHVKTLRLKLPTKTANKVGTRFMQQNHQHQMQQTQHQTTVQKKRLKAHDADTKSVVVDKTKQQQQHALWNGSTYVTSKSNKILLKDNTNTTDVILKNLTSPLIERNFHPSYKEEAFDVTNSSSNIIEIDNENSKENVSPMTATNVFNMIDKLTFTPTTINLSKPNQSNLEVLALLPTPTSPNAINLTSPEVTIDYFTEIKPRCLSNELQDEIICNPDLHNETKGTTIIITNRTFDVKNESLEISPNVSSNEGCESIACSLTNNKTNALSATPVARSLPIIQEEDNSPIVLKSMSKVETQKIIETSKKSEKDLKRDIKLIGTPLRKYSESMKNLNQQSPQSILITQGSLPNLHEMESIKFFEKNRYFKQNTSRADVKSSSRFFSVGNKSNELKSKLHSESADQLNYSQISLVSHPDLQFNQNEILAQSSRFNLNEVGLKYRGNSTILLKSKTNNSIKSNLSKTSKNLKALTETRKRRLNEFSFSDSPSMDSVISGSSSTSLRTVSAKFNYVIISPPKRQRLEMDSNIQKQKISHNDSAYLKAKNWSQSHKYKLSKTLSLEKKPLTPRKAKDQPRIKLYEANLYLQPYISPDPFAATTTCDPFLASTMYIDEASVDKYQTDLKKWLNALVSIPADLDTDSNTKIDVGKLFNEVRHKDLVLAPTKEEQSINYLTYFRLESLRRAAVELFLSEDIRAPCSKVAVYVKKNALRIRNDRNLHLDVVTQREILELLLCFNPLWLRLGLEVVYGEKIHLQSNRDIVGLSSFILNRLFRDKILEQKYSKAYTLSDEYADHIKKLTLQKFLFLLLFLDKAKEKRIIAHNPCLFVKKSPHKETRAILLRFSSELLANIGDITRELKRLGYVLTHKQSYMDEFDYAFHNLAIDLRNGIRLTRVMEIILLRDDLTKQLRVPAISRLQKVFNVNLALKALKEANFQLTGDILANDIVDGHREKTLSLLWQIIYKFRSPKFHAAARVIQKWWRHSWLKVALKRKIRYKEEQKHESAAIKIQALYRSFAARQYVNIFKKQRTRAAIVFQKYIRRFLIRKRFLKTVQSISLIQKWWRSLLTGRQCRKNFLQWRKSAICLQQHWRNRKQAIFLRKQGALEKCEYIQQRNGAASLIQAVWRGYKVRKELSKTISAVLVCQRFFRGRQLMKAQSEKYFQLRNTTVFLQTKFRAKLAMKKQKKMYQLIRSHIIYIQHLYRATILMRKQRKDYLNIIRKVVWIQQKWRATLLARRLRKNYLAIQHYTWVVQQKFRAKKQMEIERKKYLYLKTCVNSIQQRFRNKLEMRSIHCKFKKKLQAIKTIQIYFRAYKAMSYERAKYQRTRKAVLCLQKHFKDFMKMKKERNKFLQLKQAAEVIQTAYRTYCLMKMQKNKFLRIKQAVVCIQTYLRRILAMKAQRKDYIRIRSLVIFIQTRYKAILLARKTRMQYLYQRTIIINLQRRFRANKLMLKEKIHFQLIKNIVKFQAHARGLLARRRFQALLTPEMFEHLRQKKAVSTIQRFWRGYRIRKSLNNVRIKAIRNNIALLKVTSNTVNSIKFKVHDSVRLLQGKFSASEALNVLTRLDRISRTVPHLLMFRSNFISTFCYGIMAQAIRSEVDKQLIMYCSRIILNLARYNSITANTFQKGGLVTIAQMLLRWCDKDCEIFNTLCTLIWVFAHCPVKRKIIHHFMTTTDAIYMVRETKKLLDRKEKMKQNARKSVATKTTLSSVSSTRGFPQQQQQQFPNRALPSLEPDYGIIRNKPYIFASSVYAFDTILCKLDIDIF